MGLFFGDTDLGQVFNDGLGLDFQFSGKLVNANLVFVGHQPSSLLFWVLLIDIRSPGVAAHIVTT
jgi:hypothetical protein